jgi:hypothetical protein
MAETVSIVVIVAGAALYLGFSLFRTIAGRKKSCNCTADCLIKERCKTAENTDAEPGRPAQQ